MCDLTLQMGVSSYPGAAQSAYATASAAAAAANHHHHHHHNSRAAVVGAVGTNGVVSAAADCLDYEAKFQVL